MSSIEFLEPHLKRMVIEEKQGQIFLNNGVYISTSTKSEGIKFIESDLYELKLIYIKNELLTQILTSSKEIIDIILNNIYNPKKYTEIPLLYLNLAKNKKFISEKSTKEFMKFFIENCFIKTIKNIPQQKVVKRMDSEKKENINFFLESNDTIGFIKDHLSLFLCIRYADDKHVSNNSTYKDLQVKGEKIIVGGKVSQERFSFYLASNNQIWEGKVKEKLGKYYTEERFPRELVRKRTYNTKIEDRRVVRNAQENINVQTPTIDRFQTLDILDGKYYLKSSDSPIKFIEKTSNGINLSIDILGLLRKNSILYNVINNIDEEDISNFELLDIKIYRKRVRERRKPAVTSLSSLFSGENIQEQEREDFLENEEKVYLPKRSIAVGRDGFIMGVSIRDKEYVDQITTGDYCYGVELFFLDPIVPLIERQIIVSEEARKTIEKYELESTVVGHIDATTGEWKEGNYDPEINEFTQKFKQNWDSKRSEFDAPLLNYIRNLAYLNNTQQDQFKREIELLLGQVGIGVHPLTGSPSGISLFLNYYDNALRQLKRIYEQNKNRNLMVEEKYFNQEQHVISKRNNPQELQQYPFSLKISTFTQTGFIGGSVIEGQNVGGDIVGNVTLTEYHNGYDLIKEILEVDADLEISEDFWDIVKVRRPMEPITMTYATTSPLVEQLHKVPTAKKSDMEQLLRNAQVGLGGATANSTSLIINEKDVSNLYQDISRKKIIKGAALNGTFTK